MDANNFIYFQIQSAGEQITEWPKELKEAYVLGRQSATGTHLCDVVVDDPYASRKHCRIFRDPKGGGWMLEDLRSANGTKLNGNPVIRPLPITEECWIQIGTTRIAFSAESKHPQIQTKTLNIKYHEEQPPKDDSDSTLTVNQVQGAKSNQADDATLLASSTLMGADRPDPLPQQSHVSKVDKDETLLSIDLSRPSYSEDAQTVMTKNIRPDRMSMIDNLLKGDETVAQFPSMIQSHLQGDETVVTSQKPSFFASFFDDKPKTMLQADHAALAVPPRPPPDPPQPVPSAKTAAPPSPIRRDMSEVHDEAIRLAMHSTLIYDFINNRYLDDRQVMKLLEESQNNGKTFFRTLVMDRSVKYFDLIFRTISQHHNWSLLDDAEELASKLITADWLPVNLAGEKGILALRSDDPQRICFGMIDPFDVMTRDWVSRCTKKSPDQLDMVLIHPDIFFPTLRRLKEAPHKGDDDSGVAIIEINPEEERLIREQIGSVDIPKIVDYFLYRAYVLGASDIHIEPMEDALMVRNRVDGILHEEITLPMDFHSEAVSRLKILSGMDVAEKRRPQDGRISTRISSNPIDVRVSSFPTVFGEKFVLRLLDKNALRPSMDSLGLVDRDLRLLKEKLGAPYGLVMISGPTGSGKTTTLYSCLGAIDKNRKNVLTVEDPVEYRLAGVHQMQVNHKIGLTFATGLRTILRQDPDVIMVGEIRDKETAEMAVQASLTGHIVFSTIHTNDAVGVVGRLLDMGIEPFLVATSLSLVIAQRLVRTICNHCKIAVSGQDILLRLASDGVTQHRLAAVGIDIDPEIEYTQGMGCSHCRDSGYQGRRAVFEVFEITDEVRIMVMSSSMTTADLKALARQAGMTSLISHGVQLVEEEVTTFEEVIRVLGEES